MEYNRYLINFDTAELEKAVTDVLIIGSGIAGVYTALSIDEKYRISILTKEKVEISNSVLAQGGIAVSLDKKDSPEMHLRDTLYAGAGLCNEDNVRVLVSEAAENIRRLCTYGVEFDKSTKGDNTLALSREAAHSTSRIIHAGDATGKEVCDKLIHTASQRKNIEIHEETWVMDLLVKDGACYGVLAYDENEKKHKVFYAGLVICASGGYGNLYQYTTNPEVAAGDGAAFSLRAGAELMDMEFVQFHPTVLYHPENRSFLISEAVRGDGAILRNRKGERFMPAYHELAELAPRDVVARSIFSELQKTGDTHVYLDITHKDRTYLENRFPTIFRTCLKYGIDISKDYIPVAPAEHYCMGGIHTGLFGNTPIRNYYACGEAACNGIHGANRLASNSLLEGLVFGNRIGQEAEALLAGRERECPQFVYQAVRTRARSEDEVRQDIALLRKTMTDYVGIVRDADGLYEALRVVMKIKDRMIDCENVRTADYVLQNEMMIAEVVILSAIERRESRGAHYRKDFPKTNDSKWRRNIIKKLI